MIQLKLNKEQEVNQSQFNLIRSHFSSLIAWRKEENKFFIKPLLFQGYKTQLESMLNKLN